MRDRKMAWQEHFKVDPTEILISSKNEALKYFIRRDLLDEKVKPIKTLWELSEVEKILRRQTRQWIMEISGW
jgi:hypothetical protein